MIMRTTFYSFASALLVAAAGCPGESTTTMASASEASTTETTGTGGSTSTSSSTTTSEPTTSGSTTAEGTTTGTTTGATGTTAEPTTGSTGSSSGASEGSTGAPAEVLIVPGFETPESVHWSADENAWFVSNIVGMPTVKDGDGYISKLHADGSVDTMQWATGMDGPAGLRAANGKLYAADVDRIHEIDLATGMIAQSVTIQGAMFLNDVAIGQGGVVIVSDTLTNTIHQWTPGKMPMVLVKDPALRAPNGLIVRTDIVFCASIGSIMQDMIVGPLSRIQNKTVTQVGMFEGKFDGIEIDGMNGFLITDFSGKLQRVAFDGTFVETVRDFVAMDGLMSTADFGFDPMTRVAGIPDLVGGVVAFWTVP